MENELGNDRKNCLCVVSCRETTRVAKRSRVSWEGWEVRKRMGEEEGSVLLGKGDHAWWSSSCVRRRLGERHRLALFYGRRRGGEREEEEEDVGVGGGAV